MHAVYIYRHSSSRKNWIYSTNGLIFWSTLIRTRSKSCAKRSLWFTLQEFKRLTLIQFQMKVNELSSNKLRICNFEVDQSGVLNKSSTQQSRDLLSGQIKVDQKRLPPRNSWKAMKITSKKFHNQLPAMMTKIIRWHFVDILLIRRNIAARLEIASLGIREISPRLNILFNIFIKYDINYII